MLSAKKAYRGLGQAANHEGGQKSGHRGERVGQSKDRSGEVRGNVQSVAQITRSHGSVQRQLNGEDGHGEGTIVSHEDQGDHHKTRWQDGCAKETSRVITDLTLLY